MQKFSISWILSAALLLSDCGWRQADSVGGKLTELEGSARGWSVVLLTVDTLRWDRLGAYGYSRRPTSPRIDQLVASGARFERAKAPRALTWPSLASVLTGVYPSTHGVIANGYSFPDDLLTLPRILHEEGYQTGAFLSNMCRANHQGWDEFFCGGGVDKKVVRNALEWSHSIDPESPFLLWVHLFGAHPPYYNGGALAAEVLDPDYEGPLTTDKEVLDRVMREKIDLDAADLAHLDAIYDAAVMGTDRFVGELLDGLKSQRRLENAVVVFLADHGEDLYQHNRYLYHACSVYQTSLHVPLALAAPGLVPAGASVPHAVELMDIAPTVLGLLGLSAPDAMQGLSLIDYLEAPRRERSARPAYSEYDNTRIHTVVFENWKLIDNPDEVVPECFAGGPVDLYPIARRELYNLAEDPYETVNLAALEPLKVAQLRALIERRFGGPAKDDRTQAVPEDLKKELRALGYVTD